MKSKFFNKPDPEEQDQSKKESQEESIEVSQGGPSIASLKNNKMLIVLASATLITVVIYFLFFKGDNSPKERLEEVSVITPQKSTVAPSVDAKSPFEIEKKEEKTKEEIDVLAKPKTPDIPKLPELKDDQKDDLTAADLIEKAAPVLPEIPLQNQQQQEQLPQIASPNAQGQPGQGQQVSGAEQAKADLKISDPKYAPIIVVAGPSGPALGVGYDKNIVSLNKNGIDGLDKSKVEVKTTFVDNRANVVAQGKLLTAVLETAINTEAPGTVRAIVSHDVYGEAGNNVLISKGSRLYGAYSSQIVRGQARVQINWTRLIRPDGVDLAISSIASDQFGRSGIEGEVDNKYGSTLTNSLLASVLGVAGVAIAEKIIGNNNPNTTTVNPQQGAVTTTANASAQAAFNIGKTVSDTFGTIISNNLNTVPVIRIPQGTRVTVIVNADMNIPSMRKQ